jgi:energy-coupling factor transport system substrate-specific component
MGEDTGKKLITANTLAAVGIGTLLMFVMMRFVYVPSGVPDVHLQFGIVILTVFAAIFGPVAGFLIGFIGHTLVDLTADGVWWAWIISDALYGLAIGLFSKFFLLEEGKFGIKQAVFFNIVQILANLLAWVVLAPLLDILIHEEPPGKTHIQGPVAACLNAAVVLIIGTLLAFGYSKTRTETK